ncbi:MULTISPECIES: LacI family DNA-binding transcriptional regulator [unclassified Streptomyces]|uniref:LacI family DNA-binding transcriptional regulator n=1 Tax=unclassified Streptomyces TaxID=2593676 RepID=UPI002DDBF371|nr:LacI family DNA-binding transcriptional regulator [Streptomyces sp. NBC_01445]WSE02581.1 LacI family transcriptional regulator [Streptomyces sp. NBC_01445]
MLGGHVRQGAAMATLMDVARAAGVSKATASRALQRPELVAEPTRLRVLDAAQRLGFHPNAAARALTTGRTGLVGLVVPTLSNPFFAPLVMGAQQTAEKTDHHLLIAVSEYDPTREAELADRLAEQADGLIMVTPVGTDAALRERARRVPLVLVDRQVGRLPAVVADTATGLAQLMDHLLDQGHRDIAYVSGPAGSWADGQRSAILRERAEQAKAQLHVLGPMPPTFDAGIEAARTLPREATAVLAYNSYLTLGLLHGLAAAHRRVPEDVSLAAADDLSSLKSTTPSVTALDVPVEEVGALAVTRLIDLLAGHHVTVTSRLPSRPVLRASTAPPANR